MKRISNFRLSNMYLMTVKDEGRIVGINGDSNNKCKNRSTCCGEEKGNGLQEDGTYRFVRNGHQYEFHVKLKNSINETDTLKRKKLESYCGVEKEKRMFWSGRPYKNEVVGDYYYGEQEFDDGYTATIDLVMDGSTVKHVVIDETAPIDYYAAEWGKRSKRLSGYGEFQAISPRTDATLVTVVNSMQLLEEQILSENRLEGEFFSIDGSSSSHSKGFVPLVNAMAKVVHQPSKFTYYAVSTELGDGLYNELIIIKEKVTNKIIEVRYDEFFADEKEEIQKDEWKQFLRQSKYHSPTFDAHEPSFKKDVDQMIEYILDSQTLDISINNMEIEENYRKLSAKMDYFMNQ